MKKPTTIDFETEEILPYPDYPPKPVGVAIKAPGKKARYYAWGHLSGNNCSREEGRRALAAAYSSGPVCFHNGKFDMDVAKQHLDLDYPAYNKVWDTMILAFLNDPHSKRLGLKDLSVALLGRQPTERDELKDWLIEHGFVRKGATRNWGAHISKAPGELVGRYACADVEMTAAVFDVLHDKIRQLGMLPAHEREMKLIPILLRNEKHGVKVDHELLRTEHEQFGGVLEKLDDWLRKYLKAPEINIDSDQELADALESSGKITDWVLTEKGARSTSKDALKQSCNDDLLLGVLGYRSALSNFHGTFMTPWLRTADRTDGWIHTQWQSTAQAEGGGTRTGRLSSTPNFQNIPSDDKLDDTMKNFVAAGIFKKIKWLPPLPHMRSYIVADTPKHVLCGRDFNGQELRVAAHYEDAEMLEAYKANPLIDLHQYGAEKIKEYVGLDMIRKQVKIIVFTILYGGGLATIAERLGTTVENAKKLRDAYFSVFPGLRTMINELQQRGRAGLPMRTWGGRLYYAEPSKVVNGRLREFSYKLTNYLIQGSSSDITKEAMIRYDEAKGDSRLLVSVHDEILIVSPAKSAKKEMAILKDAMESIELDAKLLSDGEMGYRWYGMEAVQ